MLNYVTEVDLKKYYPNLANQLWTGKTDYATQVSEAYSIVIQDLHNAGVKPERAAIPLDLKNDGSDKNVPPVWSTITSITTGSAFESHYERRILLDIGVCSGSWNFYLDGNNDTSLPVATSPNWLNASSFVITASYANSKVTQTIDETFNYVRYRIAPVTTGSINFSCAVVSNIFDSAIIHKSLAIIFRDFMKEQNDIWDLRRQMEEADYVKALDAAKYSYDENQSGDISDEEEDVGFPNITLTR